ncbi:MAG TPA: hypothetical protein DER18_18250 [Shewanella baltica]|nr:hypothetical protein [Shewanella baltica]
MGAHGQLGKIPKVSTRPTHTDNASTDSYALITEPLPKDLNAGIMNLNPSVIASNRVVLDII